MIMMMMLCVSAKNDAGKACLSIVARTFQIVIEQQDKTRKQASNEASQGAESEKGKERKGQKERKHDKQEEKRQDSLRCI
jgi:uncharacterized membrane protein YukC